MDNRPELEALELTSTMGDIRIQCNGRWQAGQTEWGVSREVSITSVEGTNVADSLIRVMTIGYQAVIDEYLDWLEAR